MKKQRKYKTINFTKHSGFVAAFILGGLFAIGLLYLESLAPLVGIIAMVFIVIIMWTASKSIKTNPKDGPYNLFVGAVTVAAGWIFGGVLILMAQKWNWWFRNAWSVVGMAFLILFLAGFLYELANPSTTVTLGSTANVTSQQAVQICNNDTQMAYQLFIVPTNETITSTFCYEGNMYADVKP